MEAALERAEMREGTLRERMAEAATDHAQLLELQVELEDVLGEQGRLEAAWIQTAEALEG